MRRIVSPTASLLLLLSGIGMAGAAVQTPESTSVATPLAVESEWQVTEIRDIDVEGEPLALSPDGRWLAGVGADGGSICVWDVESLTPTCAGEDLRMTPAMTWSPDSSAVAFLDGIVALGESDDVMVFDVAGGELANLTTMPGGGELPWHLGTAWTDDSQRIVFARVTGTTSEIVVFDRSGGTSRIVPLPDWNTDGLILAPVGVISNDELLFQVNRSNDEAIDGLWRIGLDGSGPVRVLEPGASYPLAELSPIDVSADGRYVSVYSLDAIARMDIENAFHLADLQTDEIDPVEIMGSRNVLGPPVFSPTGELALLHGGEHPDTLLHIVNLGTGKSHPVGGTRNQFHITWLMTPPIWASNDTVFIPTDDGGILLTLEHDG